jgi:glutathione synthase/RimK-type ligase-like ATP-grasp enzyme
VRWISIRRISLSKGSTSAILGRSCRFSYPPPDVILNEWPDSPSFRSPAEAWLRERIPFTTHLIEGKQQIYKRLHPKFGRYLIPKESLVSSELLLAFLNQYEDVILKPSNGRNGNHIYRVKLVDRCIPFQGEQQPHIVTEVQLKEQIDLLLAKHTYMMQQYWPVLSEHNEPTDYRVHVQRDEDGHWQITKIYPRSGREGAVVSNISKGGSTADIDEYLRDMFVDRAVEMKIRLENIAIQLAKEIDGFYYFLIDELGIDLLMNEQGDVRFLEANTGPETRYHEDERAKRTIGFAKYVTRAYQDKLDRDRPTIGLLSLNSPKEVRFREACA